MEKDELLIIKLCDCFTAGYTLPQYCIDNGIKKPLFIAEEKFWQTIWEIYVQFFYDKRLSAKFSFIGLSATTHIDCSFEHMISAMEIKPLSELTLNDCDTIICLTSKKIFSSNQVTYLDELTNYFARKTYLEIPLMNFLRRYPAVKVFYTLLPLDVLRYENDKNFADRLVDWHILRDFLKDNMADLSTPIDKFGYTNQEVYDLICMLFKSQETFDGTTLMADNDHHLIKIKNGKRMTAYQPDWFKNKIYFFGPCHYVGSFAPFDKTIESYLQALLNANNLPYRVENEGQNYVGRYQDLFYNLNKLNPLPGDIIFIYIENLTVANFPVIDLSTAFDLSHDYKEFFF